MRLRSMCGLFAAVVLVHPGVFAGSLNPPAGPIASTGRFGPRIEINEVNTPGDADSQFRITQRGSYYLARAITGESGKSAIEIASRGVTIDLGGNEILGVAGAESGISIGFGGVRNLDIRNGSFLKWPIAAIEFSSAEAIRLADITIEGGGGILVGPESIVERCILRECTGTSLACQEHTQVIDCTIEGALASGSAVGADCTFRGVAIVDSASQGLFAGLRFRMYGCTVSGSGGLGIEVSAGALIENCTAIANAGIGIDCSARSVVVGCLASNNAGSGIVVDADSLVSGCQASSNDQDGILVGDRCYIVGNLCTNNGFAIARAGIQVLGEASRIDANNMIGNGIGLSVIGDHNFVVRNSARGSFGADYSISGANNDYAQIVINPGPGFVNSNPWANFDF